ncbi:MAG TPA: hypothetical protein ENI97_06865 [Gammaproteobacteria bacterium]|nr:hypothetical protein [Gammaproteobacteria bacterium]
MSSIQDPTGSDDSLKRMEATAMQDATNKVRTLSPVDPTHPNEPQWYEEDSINLVDLWLELIKHRRIIFAAVTLALLGGLLVAFLLPQKYTYTTSIEIGYSAEDSDGGITRTPIDNPETVLAKLKESYIPLTLQTYARQHPNDAGMYSLEARVAKGSKLITLEGKGPETLSTTYIQLLQGVLDNLLADHQRITGLSRANLQTQIDKARLALAELEDPRTLQVKIDALNTKLNEAEVNFEKLSDPRVLEGPLLALRAKLQKAEQTLEQLRDPRFFAATRQVIETKIARSKKHLSDMQDQAKLIKARYQRVDETDALLKKQITELQEQIASSLQRRQQALDGLQGEASAMTMLMVDNEIQQNRLRLANLEERLYISQPDQRQKLEDQLAANLREQGVQRQLLGQFESDLQRVILENQQQQALQTTTIKKLKGDLQRLKLTNQRAQQLDKPRVAQIKAKIAKLRADHERALSAQRQNIQLLQARLNGLAETHALTPPMQSMRPTGPGKAVIIVLSLLLGLMLGVFAAFFASFLDKVRQQTKPSNAG